MIVSDPHACAWLADHAGAMRRRHARTASRPSAPPRSMMHAGIAFNEGMHGQEARQRSGQDDDDDGGAAAALLPPSHYHQHGGSTTLSRVRSSGRTRNKCAHLSHVSHVIVSRIRTQLNLLLLALFFGFVFLVGGINWEAYDRATLQFPSAAGSMELDGPDDPQAPASLQFSSTGSLQLDDSDGPPPAPVVVGEHPYYQVEGLEELNCGVTLDEKCGASPPAVPLTPTVPLRDSNVTGDWVVRVYRNSPSPRHSQTNMLQVSDVRPRSGRPCTLL